MSHPRRLLAPSRRSLLLGLALGPLALHARSAPAAEPGVSAKDIVVGQTISLNGGRNEYAVAVLDGMRLAFDEANAQGGVHGRRIVLRTLDDSGKPPDAEKNVRQLLSESVFLLFGPVEGGPSTAVAKVAAEARVPLFGPVAGAPGLRVPHNPMTFPVRAAHRDEFHALMTWGRQTGLKTVAFLHADSPVGAQHLENVRLIAKELGMAVTHTVPFKGAFDAAQMDVAARALVQAAPDLMLNHGAVDLYAELVGKAKAAGSKTTFMGVNSGSTQIARVLGEAAKGMVFAQVVPNPLESKHAISRAYRAAALAAAEGVASPGLSYGGLEGYLTAKALVAALHGAGPQPTRQGFVQSLYAKEIVVDGIVLRYRPDDHQGSKFVDLSIVSRWGRFMH